MLIKMKGSLIAVEKASKKSSTKNPLGTSFVIPDVSDSFGTVQMCGPDVTKVSTGDKVYFGAKHETIRMAGADYIVMDQDNVYAIATDE